MVQWLRLHTFNAENIGLIPGREQRFHMSFGLAKIVKKGKKCFKFKKIRIFPAIPIHTIAQSNQRVNNGKVAILANK